MEKKLTGTNIFDSIETVLRNSIPGVVFCLLFGLYYPRCFENIIPKLPNSQLIVFLLILTIGMLIYTIHKMTVVKLFDIIAYCLIGCSPVNCFAPKEPRLFCLRISRSRFSPWAYSKAHAELLLYREKSEHYPKSYFYLLWATVHFSLMVSELLIIFECDWFNELFKAMFLSTYHCCTTKASLVDVNCWIITIIAILSTGYFFFLQYLEKNMVNAIQDGYRLKG
jgi:hypothetical protein